MISSLALAGLVAALLAVPATRPAGDAFAPDAPLWPDDHGRHLDAHGGGLLLHDGLYYWYGEQRGTRRAGVRLYTSADLYHWADRGTVLSAADDESSDFRAGCILERPKVIYNAKTGKFVMWFHLELAGLGYAAARTAVAVADAPEGPFTYLRSVRPHAGRLPTNAPVADIGRLKEWKALVDAADDRDKVALGSVFLRDLPVGQMSRDMTLFVDDDGTAWHVASGEENATLLVSKLADDYLDFAGEFARVLPGGRNEAPAVFKDGGKYYLITSGLTGWAPNAARSAVADAMLGPWTPLGNPCAGGPNPRGGGGPELTFGGQSTFVLPAPGRPGKFVAMFDVWTPRDLRNSRYVWLPLEVVNGKPVVSWHDRWDLSIFDPATPATRATGSAAGR